MQLGDEATPGGFKIPARGRVCIETRLRRGEPHRVGKGYSSLALCQSDHRRVDANAVVEPPRLPEPGDFVQPRGLDGGIGKEPLGVASITAGNRGRDVFHRDQREQGSVFEVNGAGLEVLPGPGAER